MTLTQVASKRTGRPQADACTVRVLKSGVARLSPDLCIGSEFTIQVDKKKKRIVLTKTVDMKRFNKTAQQHYALWYSSKAAKSGLISIISALRELGLENAEGRYAAKRKKDSIIVELSRKLGG